MTGKPVELDGYGRRLMDALEPNTPLLDYYRRLRDERGVRLAVLTNNVREWQPIWRPRFEIDELFELVVDSGFEGTRKPEPEIYALTLERLGLSGEDCAFVDDVEVNVTAAREAGMHGIHFRDTAQATAELEALVLAAEPVPDVELQALGQELGRALAREPRQHALERLLLGHAGGERVLAAQAGGDLQRLAPVLARAT